MNRLARLQAVTAALSGSPRLTQVAEVVVAQGVEALGASAGVVVQIAADGVMLELLRSQGYPEEALASWQAFPLSTSAPISDAVRNREPIFLSSLEDWRTHYPDTAGIADQYTDAASSWAAIPLVANDHVLGGLGLTFPPHQVFTTEDKSFMLALARQCAQAMERAQLYEEAQQARRGAEEERQRMAFLAEASGVFASSLEYRNTLVSVVQMAVPRLGDWCAVDMLTEDGADIERLAVTHIDPRKVEWAHELSRKYPPRLDAPDGLGKVLRTGEVSFYPLITDEMLIAGAQSEEQLTDIRAIGLESYLCVPLAARGRILGALTLATTAESGRHYTESDLRLAQELASRAALAVDNARLYGAAQRERAEAANILESITDAFLALDREWRYTYVNRRTEAYLGRTREELIGKVIWDEYPLMSPFEAHYRRAMRDRVAVDVEEQSAISGRWLEVHAYPSETGLSIYFRDVTERHEAEEERKRAALVQRAFVKDVLASVTEGRLQLCYSPEELPAPLRMWADGPIELSDRALKRVRTDVETAAKELGFSSDRQHDILTAVSEAAMNAVVHAGGGVATVRGEGSILQIWIEDRGAGIAMDRLPRVTLEPGYTTGSGLGHGFWLMLKTVDRVWLLTGPSGTVLVLEQDRAPRTEPHWLAARSAPALPSQ